MTTSELRATTPKSGQYSSRFNILVAASLFIVALLSIWGLQSVLHIDPFGASNVNYFVYQAESFLHGHWDLNLSAELTDIVVRSRQALHCLSPHAGHRPDAVCGNLRLEYKRYPLHRSLLRPQSGIAVSVAGAGSR